MSAYIRYPEAIKSTIRLFSLNPPKAVVSPIDGRVAKVLVKNGQWVESGTNLAFFESAADHEGVLSLLSQLEHYLTRNEKLVNIDRLPRLNSSSLGELQQSYEVLYASYLHYKAAFDGGIYDKQKSIIDRELNNIKLQHARTKKSLELLKTELESEKRELNIDGQGMEIGILTSGGQTFSDMEDALIELTGDIIVKEKELVSLESQLAKKRNDFFRLLYDFIVKGEHWTKQYVLSAGSNGKVIYTPLLCEGQSIEYQQKIFYIDPEDNNYYGEILLKENLFRQVKVGHPVLIRVRNYPYEEFVYLHGRVHTINGISDRDSLFLVSIALNSSSQDSALHLTSGMMADAEIHTDNRSILGRIWANTVKSIGF